MVDLSRPPDFVNEAGVKWWVDAALTRYAVNKLGEGHAVWAVEHPSGYKTRLLTHADSVKCEAPSIEGMAIKIDILAFAAK